MTGEEKTLEISLANKYCITKTASGYYTSYLSFINQEIVVMT